RLGVPAGLAARIIGGRTVERQVARFAAAKIFALELEAGDRGVAARRPLDDEVGDPERAAAAERAGDRVAGGITIVEGAIAIGGAQVRQPGAPGDRLAYVAADVAVERPQAGAVAVRVAAGKAAPATDLGAELEQQLA